MAEETIEVPYKLDAIEITREYTLHARELTDAQGERIGWVYGASGHGPDRVADAIVAAVRSGLSGKPGPAWAIELAQSLELYPQRRGKAMTLRSGESGHVVAVLLSKPRSSSNSAVTARAFLDAIEAAEAQAGKGGGKSKDPGISKPALELARANGIDVAKLAGTGPAGKIIVPDVELELKRRASSGHAEREGLLAEAKALGLEVDPQVTTEGLRMQVKRARDANIKGGLPSIGA